MRIGKTIIRMARMSVSRIKKMQEAQSRRAKPDISDYIEAKLTFAQQVERELP